MQPRAAQGQLQCSGCRVTLAYPMGAPSVRCPLCTAVTPVGQITISCVCCRTNLALPVGTHLAMCPRCRTVMSIPSSANAGISPQQQMMSQIQQQRMATKQCVYIENPTTHRDSHGEIVNTMLVGTKVDEDGP